MDSDKKSASNDSSRQKTIPLVAFETIEAQNERRQNRLLAIIVLLVVLLVGTNCAWLWYESQFSTVVTTIESEQDGSGVNIISGGDLHYGTEAENYNP